ncbi:response regulator [Janthinobacterium agaricidamnosum]|uniref:Response regulator n=1 Tax=Janthinobacterium agaricidamnosum TaxID=55508 RepID=A0A3G2E5G6_9BURK|nr:MULTISPECIES: response regulator [Janthinobacterium]AYM75207.1 response regulator [Janthinobacterium agaricidamnosum]
MANQLSPLRIMIVDDNRDAADLIAEFLVICGYEAVPVYGGAEALRTADRFAPDVVFLDLGMPGVNGFQVASTLRQAPRFQQVKMIALTAWSDEATRTQTKAVGFDHHLVKPADLDDILGLLSVGA